MKQVVADTNVLVSFLTDRDLDRQARARQLNSIATFDRRFLRELEAAQVEIHAF